MKTAVILLSILPAVIAHAEPQSSSWPMFQRKDVVPLADKVIPESNKRNKITDPEGRAIAGEWLSIDRAAKVVKFRRASDGKEFNIAFSNLAALERRYAELETGLQWDPGEAAKRLPKPNFDPKEPMLDDKGRRQKTTFNEALRELESAYTPDEVIDHLRARTLTTSFIFEYDNEWKGNYGRGTSREKGFDAAHVRTLAQIMPMLVEEPQSEIVSLKESIDKLGLKLFEEKAPNTPPGKEGDKREFGTAGDGLAQANHFVAQYIGLSNGKTKVPYANYIKETTPMAHAAWEGNPMWFSYDWGTGPMIAVERAHQAKAWWHPPVLSSHSLLMEKVTRQFVRKNKPVVVPLLRPNWPGTQIPPKDAKEGYGVIIGFKLEKGKVTYDALMIYCPNYGGSSLRPPFASEYKANLGPEYFEWSRPTFIE